MRATLLLPLGNYKGNLLWRKTELLGKEEMLEISLTALRAKEYWASPFPEGDGVTFDYKYRNLSSAQVLADFQAAFPWLRISIGSLGCSNFELAALEDDAQTSTGIACKVIVPVLKLHFESSFDLGPFRFICACEFDSESHERLGDWKGCYLEFDINLNYSELLRLNQNARSNDVVILQCLSMAEHALDLIRFGCSSFLRPEFTPDPAGQLESGFYAVEVIPMERTHLKSFNLLEISRPMSVSNNWLGPDIDNQPFLARRYLEKILNGQSDELALAVKGALRFIRQAFYSLGDESKFLTLVFALDGLAHPEKNWTWIKHHAYIAALTSGGDINRFKADLERYEELYTNVRNALVHSGKDFYELPHDAAASCEDLFDYLRDVVLLIDKMGFTTILQLRTQAIDWLKTPAFSSQISTEVTRLNSRDGKSRPVPTW